VLTGDPDVDEKEFRTLKPAADLMNNDIKPGQDDDERRGLGREFRHGVDPGESLAGQFILERRTIDDQKPPGLGILTRRREPGRFQAGQELLFFHPIGLETPDAAPGADELLKSR